MRSIALSWLRRRREETRGVLRRVRALAYRGNDVECSTCGWHGRLFPRSQCPRCSSLARHRLIAFALDHFRVRVTDQVVLHIGPNQLEIDGVSRCGTPRIYLKSDLQRRRFINVVADGTALPVADASLDLVIIWHVLEHIPDDRAVIEEMFRSLRPGGAVLASVPIYPPGRTHTDEDPTTPVASRLAVYGHPDHVRSCGLDYAARFTAAGFEVSTLSIDELASPGGRTAELVRKGLSRSHVAWLCRRPPAAT